MSREDWLIRAIDKLKPRFEANGFKVPAVKVSVGFPTGSAKKVIGQFWRPEASDDLIGSVFISPIIDKGTRALDILVHELVHAVVGVKEGHGPAFKRCAVALGLTGKMTATKAGPELTAYLEDLISQLGPYPHSKLNLQDNRKKQSTRMIKMSCEDCGYIARASKSAIELHGPVICPCSLEPMRVEA